MAGIRRRQRTIRRSEEHEQESLAAWLNGWGILWCHPPNEIRANYSYLAKRRRLGVKAGVPDVIIFDRPPRNPSACGVAIELKREDGGRVTDTQQQWIEALGARGWLVSICYGADDAIAWLERLGYGSATTTIPER